jgi:hypothetical protein
MEYNGSRDNLNEESQDFYTGNCASPCWGRGAAIKYEDSLDPFTANSQEVKPPKIMSGKKKRVLLPRDLSLERNLFDGMSPKTGKKSGQTPAAETCYLSLRR